MQLFHYAERMSSVSGSAIREIFKLLSNPCIISFAGGMPSPDAFPAADVARITEELMRTSAASVLQYGITEGWTPLRESIVALLQSRGIEAQIDNILTLTGSSQGIELVAKVMLDPGDVVLVEAPTFLGALQTFCTYQATLSPLTMDDDGVNPEEMEAKIKALRPKLIYLIPTFQNPTGRTLSLERRKRVAELAAKYGVLLIEDDPYAELRYRGDPLPAIKAFDETGRVLLLGSFSKTVSPGLRVGFAAGDPALLRKMVIAKQGMDTHTSNLSQAIIDRLLREGAYLPHVQEICRMYSVRLEAMLRAMDRHFPEGVRCKRPDGGLFALAELPDGVNAHSLLPKAVERGVAYIPGEHFFVGGSGKNTMRLNFSMPDEDKIDSGMKILGELFALAIA